jgi:hypothetical protein
MTSNRNPGFFQLDLSFIAFSVLLFTVFAFGEGTYHIIKKIPVAGQGGWDYLIVDEAARRLYVSHGTQVKVIDADSGTIVGNIPNTLGVHSIALAPELGLASSALT